MTWLALATGYAFPTWQYAVFASYVCVFPTHYDIFDAECASFTDAYYE